MFSGKPLICQRALILFSSIFRPQGRISPLYSEFHPCIVNFATFFIVREVIFEAFQTTEFKRFRTKYGRDMDGISCRSMKKGVFYEQHFFVFFVFYNVVTVERTFFNDIKHETPFFTLYFKIYHGEKNVLCFSITPFLHRAGTAD